MAFDEALADRVRDLLVAEPGYGERKMFGGLCLMLDGHMTCGIVGESLMLRLTEQLATEALGKPHVRPMDFTGRPMRNMVYVDPAGLRGRALRTWIELAVTSVRSLPPKSR